MSDKLVTAARKYLEAGLSVVPTCRATKKPVCEWGAFQKAPMSVADSETLFNGRADSLAIIGGAVSGNLNILDFDFKSELFEPWRALVEDHCPGLTARLAHESTQSGGAHVVYRCRDAHIAGNTKLASRGIETPSAAEIEIDGKKYKPRKIGDKFFAVVTLIETRGEGGYCLCAPSPGYLVQCGQIENPPELTPAEHKCLIACAQALSEWIDPSKIERPKKSSGDATPWGDYDARADITPLLEKHGWTRDYTRGKFEHWRRPGKTKGVSASLIEGRIFNVFSTNAAPLDAKAYSKSAVYAMLEHGGDFKAAAKALRKAGYGTNGTKPEVQDSEGAPPEPPKSQATLLIELAAGVELFHTPDTDGDTYATITVQGHKETWRLRSKAFRIWLQRQFYERFKKVAGGQAVDDALGILEARARFDGHAHPVSVRLAAQNSAIYLDLGDEEWRAVEVATSGWRVISDPPVKFIRPRGMLTLPDPQRGGNVAELRQLLNITDDDWPLVLMWLLNACRETGPFIILVVNGEQGSAKSTFCRILVALLDPHKAALRAAPRDERDLMISANNSWVLAFDNLSSIPLCLSDALCRLATGGGLASRELYTDAEEKIFEAQRPVLINGIEELATRPDLVDRVISITLPPLDDTQRRDEAEISQTFEAVRPRFLGVLLDAVSTALRNLPNVKLERRPRMADAARWAVAGESALGLAPGTFISRYSDNRQQADDLVLDSNMFGTAVRTFMAGRENWQGTATELGKELASGDTANAHGWPKTARAISGALRRIAPNLRRIGITTVFNQRDSSKKRTRLIRLEDTGKQPSTSSASSDATGRGADDSGRLCFGADGAAT